MWEPREREANFTLIDHDMGVVVPNERDGTYIPSSKHRTGTLPFMSYELVMNAFDGIRKKKNWHPVHHRLHHEFHSLFIVCVWCLTALHLNDMDTEEKEDLLGFLRAWEKSESLRTIAHTKRVLCLTMFQWIGCPITPTIRPFLAWLDGWRKVFVAGDNALVEYTLGLEAVQQPGHKPEVFDFETLGSEVTKDTLKAALTPFMPTRSAELTEDTMRGLTGRSRGPPPNKVDLLVDRTNDNVILTCAR